MEGPAPIYPLAAHEHAAARGPSDNGTAAGHPCAEGMAGWLNFATVFAQEHGLSSRECQILEQVLCGQSNPELARRLGITTPTVRFHLKSIYRKVGVKDRLQLVLKVFSFCWHRARTDVHPA